MKKIKLLHIEDRFHPGMGYQLNFFAKLHSDEFQVEILTSKSLSIWNTNYLDIKNLDREFEKKYNVKIHRINYFLERPGKRNILLKDIYKKINKIKPNIIYLHGIETYTALKFFFNLNKYKKYKIVADTHTLLNQMDNSLKGKLLLKAIRQIVSKKINKYKIITFATVPENREIANQIYGINQNLIKDLPIGTDTEEYRYSDEARKMMRQKFNIPSEATVIIYTGKFDNNKKPHLIVEAVREIESLIDTDIWIFFVGAKPSNYYKKHFQNIIFTNNYIHIHIEPFTDSKELYKYYSMADFGVIPTENSLSSLDMQASKLPVIMQNDPTNQYRLKYGGLLYKPDDITDLANKILELIKNKQLREKLREEGYNYIKSTFDYKIIVKNLEKIIKKLVLSDN